MAPRKRVGSLAVALAVFIAVAGLLLSSELCPPQSVFHDHVLQWLLRCNGIYAPQFLFDDPDYPRIMDVYLAYSHVLLTAFAIALIGVLWIIGALPVPFAKPKPLAAIPGEQAGSDD
jgi:hypothetical protein